MYKREIDNNKINLRKLTTAALLAAIAIVCSPFSIPIGASKCFPVQHFVNVIAGIFLGPFYAVGAAFVTSLIRNLMGTGSLLAFPGSMCGAFLSGFLYSKFKKLPFAYLGELIGTAIIGGLLSFPIASFVMAKEAAVFMYVIPFFISSSGGTLIAAILVPVIKKAGIDKFLSKTNVNGRI